MYKQLISHYKIPLLIAVTLSIVLIALRVEREVLPILLIFLGTFLGTFILDLDYLVYAYFLEPDTEFSQTIQAYMKHRDYGNVISYIHYHKDQVTDRTLNSVLFQVVLAAAVIFVIASSTSLFTRALVVSVFVNSIYRLSEHIATNDTDKWFWSLKSKPSKNGVLLYIFVMMAVLVFSLSIF